jgi:2-polyprenyl-3-methyl-5-hydroxy-6-metoxy-1,4-benzoquinol methylase
VIYQRRFDPDSGDSLARLARWLSPGTTVLELGAAAGYFTEWMRGRGCTVDVIEIDPEAADAARPFARRVVVADLDAEGWEDSLRDAAGEGGNRSADLPRYDFIVCADVLEHLRDGVRLLSRLRPLLAPGGELLLSVPNVAHAAVVAGLLDDRFEYGGEGLLDPTHLHLYTWRSLAAALRDAGFAIRAWDATEMTPYASEFRTRVEALPPALREALGPGTRHQAYQWLVRAAPGLMEEPPAPPVQAGGERVPVRLLHAANRGVFSLVGMPNGFIPANGDAATLDLAFAPGAGALRLLLADRIGVVTVEAFALHAGEREVWRRGAPGDTLHACPDAIPVDADRYVLVRNDAWIEPEVDAARLATVDRARVTLRWAGDWTGAGAFSALTGLADAIVARTASAQREIDRLKIMIEERDTAIAARDARVADSLATLASAERTLGAAREVLARRESDLATVRADLDSADRTHDERGAELARMEAALAAQERIILHRQTLRWWIALPFLRLKLLFFRGRRQ